MQSQLVIALCKGIVKLKKVGHFTYTCIHNGLPFLNVQVLCGGGPNLRSYNFLYSVGSSSPVSDVSPPWRTWLNLPITNRRLYFSLILVPPSKNPHLTWGAHPTEWVVVVT